MKKIIPLLIVFLLVMLPLSGGCSDPPAPNGFSAGDSITVTDLSNRKVELKGPAERIVAIGPGALRLVCYVNGADKVVGVEQMEKNSPTERPYFMANPDLQQLPTIGPGGPRSEPDTEKLVDIKPDVIFTCLSAEQVAADRLQGKTGIPVVVLDPGTLSCFSQELYRSLDLIGKITGEEERAAQVIDYLENSKMELENRSRDIPDKDKPTVYTGGLSAAGLHGIESTSGKYPPLEAINGKNVVDETGREGTFTIDKEKLLEWDPEILFIDAAGLELVRNDYKKNSAFYRALSAVKNGRVYCLIPYKNYDTNIEITIANAYFAGKTIYPDLFRDVDPAGKTDEICRFLLGKPLFREITALFSEGFQRITID